MRNKMIFMAMAMMLYAIQGFAQIPTASINVPAHIMYSSTWDQFMPSIAVDKTRAPTVMASFTTTQYGLCSQYNYQGYYYSQHGADPCTTCTGSLTSMPNTAQSHGNPSVAFDDNGTGYLMGANGDGTGFFTVNTPDDGTTWDPTTINAHIAGTNNCITPRGTVDDLSTSPNHGNFYAVWGNTDGITGSGIVRIARKVPGGTSFVDDVILGVGSSDWNEDGPAVATGPDFAGGNDGVVYACWTEDFASSFSALKMGSAYSIDGGVHYTNNPEFNYAGIGVGYGDDSHFGSTYVNAYPSIAVDKSCGPHRGTLYMVAPEYLYNTSGTIIGSVITLWYSIDKGAHWGGGYNFPLTLTGYPYSGGGTTVSYPSGQDYCWFPNIAIDDLTGVISVVYYGFSGSASNTNTFVSYCDPSDPTNPASWHSIKVSSASQTPEDYDQDACNSNFPLYPRSAVQNPNDATGIASYGGHAYPVWKDRSSGHRQIWISDVQYGAPQLASSTATIKICPTSSLIPLIKTGTQSYEAADNIDIATCAGGGNVSIGTSTIPATLHTTAGQSIIIGQGFSTAPGSVFTAEIRNLNPCQTPGVQSSSKTDTPYLTADNNSNINNITGMNVYAYPNPATNFLTVGTDNNEFHKVSFSVTDISGRIMAQYSNPSFSALGISQVINIDSYAPGLYLVTMVADNQKYSTKFVKE